LVDGVERYWVFNPWAATVRRPEPGSAWKTKSRREEQLFFTVRQKCIRYSLAGNGPGGKEEAWDAGG
jgi:hypothetical protein